MLVLGLLLAIGCDGPDPIIVQSPSPLPPAPPMLIVSPDQATVSGGQSIQFRARVGDDSTVQVEWSVADTTLATVSATGLVQSSVCHRTGSTILTATTPGSSPLAGTARFTVIESAESKLHIVGLYRGGTDVPADVAQVSGTVDVAVSAFMNRPCPDPRLSVDSIVVYVHIPSGKTRIGTVPGFTVVPPPVPLRLRWNTAEAGAIGPKFPNGDGALTADGYLFGWRNPMVSNAVPIRIANP